MTFSKLLFRSSANGYLMTDPKTKVAKEAGELSESTKTHLIDVFVSEIYGRNTDISNKYVEKGLAVEEDSITLYSRYKKKFYTKNEEHLSNEFIKGTPDLFTGKDIRHADHVIDIKSSWDIYTFFRSRTSPVNTMYWWQLQSYMALTGAKTATLAYCLVNTPTDIIEDEVRKLFYRVKPHLYDAACDELRNSLLFDDIPMKERVHEFHINRDDEAIQRLYDRVGKCRIYLDTLYADIRPNMLTIHDTDLPHTTIFDNSKNLG